MATNERARDYQMRADRAVEAHLANGRRPLVCSPTGSGKTFMARMRIRHATRAVGIVHTKVLRDQAQSEIPELAEVFLIQGLLAKGPDAARRRERLQKSDLVWVDEAHHCISQDWVTLSPLIGAIPAFGSTATPQRADGTPLTEFWNELVIGASYSELLALGHLCQCDVLEPEVKRAKQKELKVRADGVLSYLQNARRDDGSWRPGIHTDTTIGNCANAVERYQAAGVRAALVCCDTEDDDRQRLFDQYSSGHLDMLCSPMALSEGFDSPRAEVLVSCRMFAFLGTYIQWCGRILRPYGERQIAKWTERMAAKGLEMQPCALVPKKRALLIDTTDAKDMHGMPTADRIYSLDGAGMAQVEPEEPVEPKEPQEREPAVEVEMKYQLIRDRVIEHYMYLEELARSRSYAPGWIYYKMRELNIDPPRALESKYRSSCAHCKRRVRPATQDAPGETVLWAGPGKTFHKDCWFASLTNEQLQPAYERLTQ